MCIRMSQRLPITDPRRIRARDNKLWVRDKRRASLYNFSKIPCPCSLHKGTGNSLKIEEVERHLLRHGRSRYCRTWRGPDDPDSSDEEWETEFSKDNAGTSSKPLERDNGVQIRQMMQHIYQEVEAIAETEEQLDEATMNALEASDNIMGTNINGDATSSPNSGDRNVPEESIGRDDVHSGFNHDMDPEIHPQVQELSPLICFQECFLCLVR